MRRFLILCFIFLPFISFSQFSTIELEVRPVPEPLILDSAVDSWNKSLPRFNSLSAQSQAFLYWVNYCRSSPEKFWDSVISPVLLIFPPLNTAESKSLRTDLIKTGKLSMFSLSKALINTAQLHASDISHKKAAPSHTSTDGTNFGSRMKRAGIKDCANENISVGNQSVLLSVLLLYLDIGLPNLGHRKSLLNPIFVETGIGSAPYGKEKNQFFLVQDLACLQQ